MIGSVSAYKKPTQSSYHQFKQKARTKRTNFFIFSHSFKDPRAIDASISVGNAIS